jgi:rfaE bifunctional protein kinase chain/domain
VVLHALRELNIMPTPANDYRRKIRSRDELLSAIGTRPRERSVIMCHGAFDLVHPGHLRHLMYAKGKADILVASLTSDSHITKAHHRPFVPQQLRAMNLAAYELVDYVIIDENPTPLENIKYLQPDYFAKGYEYVDGGVHPRTREEMDVLEGYGGEMIFTPGDVVYSSSRFIETGLPKIAADKLITLMESEGLTFDSLRQALRSLREVRVHVVGDTIVDSYTYCTLIGGMAKTPTFSLKYERQVDYPGGAAVVAKHLRAAGAEVKLSTVLGDDPLKDFVLKDLVDHGIECVPVVDPTRPTTQKNAFIAGGYRMLKVDKVDNRGVSERILKRLNDALKAGREDVVVFSDFRHGIFNRHTIPALTASLPGGVLKVADSQVASRWGNILDFQGFDLVTPNEREARFSLGEQDMTVRPMALELYKQLNCKHLILKLGDKGLITYRALSHDVRSFFTLDSFAGNVVDSVGAGDALLSYATLAMKVTGSPVIASILGSFSAAVACENDGNNPVSPDDVLKKVKDVEREVRFS